MRVTIGLDAHSQLCAMPSWKGTPELEQLRREILDGTSVVIWNAAEKRPERFVYVAALCIERGEEQDMFLTQLATCEGETSHSIRASVKLPGSRMRSGEKPHEAVQRILETKLSGLSQHFEILSFEREVETRDSVYYKITTKYVRTVCRVRIYGDIDELPCESRPRTFFGRVSPFRAFSKNLHSGRSQVDCVEGLCSREVYALSFEGSVIYCTWVDQMGFHELQNERLQSAIVHFVSSLYPRRGSGRAPPSRCRSVTSSSVTSTRREGNASARTTIHSEHNPRPDDVLSVRGEADFPLHGLEGLIAHGDVVDM